jgi:hypothetical protein
VAYACNPSYSGEAEIRKIAVPSQPGQSSCHPILKISKTGLVGWLKWWSACLAGLEFKFQYHQNKQIKIK